MDLFNKKTWHNHRRKRAAEFEDAIAELTEDDLSESSNDGLAIILARKYGYPQFELHDEIREDGGQVEKRIDRHDLPIPQRGPITKKVRQIDVRIPYDGERELLFIRPSKYRHQLIEVNDVTHGHIEFSVHFDPNSEDASSVESDIEGKIEDIQWFVEQLNNNIQSFNENLRKRAPKLIEKRREEVEQTQQILDAVGVESESSPSGFVEPERKREIDVTSLDTDDSGTDGSEVLPDHAFVEILEIIDDVGWNVEHASPAVRGLDEEALRDVFLTAINTHFAGLASGESFNKEGKTDLRLPYAGGDLFIGEFKFWRGPSGVEDTLDQLLDYLTVRESHAAAVFFSRRARFSEVEEKLGSEVSGHEDCFRELSEFSEHNVFRFEQGSGEPVKVAVKVFDMSA